MNAFAQLAGAQAIVQDAIVACRASDHEVLGNVIAWQDKVNVNDADEHLFVRRLVPDPPSMTSSRPRCSSASPPTSAAACPSSASP
jgi:hypothetical protein